MSQGSAVDISRYQGSRVWVRFSATNARHCQDSETKLGSKKGCITALSLLYDEDGIQWCVDEELLSVDS